MGSSTGRQHWCDEDVDWLGVECGHTYIARLRTTLGVECGHTYIARLRYHFAVETVCPHRGSWSPSFEATQKLTSWQIDGVGASVVSFEAHTETIVVQLAD